MMLSVLCSLPLALADGSSTPAPPPPHVAPAPAGAAEDDAGEGDLVVRYYDLTPLRAGELDDEVSSITLFPTCTPRFKDPNEGLWELDEDSSVDEVMEILHLLFSEEFEYEGRYMEFVSFGRLAIRGPASLHARVETCLQFLEGVFASYPGITVDVVTLPAARSIETSVIPVAEADQWIADAKQHRRYTMQLRNDQPTLIEVSTTHPLLTGYEVEIAQGAAIHDAVVGIASFGTKLLARGNLAKNGLFLSLLWERGELLGDIETRELQLASQLRTQDDSETVFGASVMQAPEVLNRSFALSTFIPTGKALVLETGVGLDRAERSEVILIRQSSGTTKPVHELQLASGAVLSAIDVGSISPSQVASYGPLLQFGSKPSNFNIPWHDDPFVLVGSSLVEDPDFALNFIADGNDMFWGISIFHWLFMAPEIDAFEDAEEMAAAQQQLRESVDALMAAPRTVDVSLRVARPGARGATSSRVTLRSGTAACLVLGIEDIDVLDYEVEVAQEVAAVRPLTYNVFDGSALWIRAGYGAGGDLTLEVRGGAHLLDGERGEVSMQSNLIEALDQSAYQHLSVHEFVRFRADDSAPWTATLGDSGKDGLRIELEVHR